MTKEAKPSADALPPERFEAVLNSISDGVFSIDVDGRITCFNRAAERITGVSRAQAIGALCHTIFRANICRDACALRYTLETGRPVADLVAQITAASGEEVPVSISTSLFRNEAGEAIGGVEIFRDLRQVEALRRQG